jgi:hypothetical protein
MTELPDWHWRIIVYLEDTGKDVLGAYEPTRAQAKQYVAAKMGGDIESWGECYVPRATWDCPVCNVHEGMTEQPNLRGDHDWECLNCMSKAWGEPLDWDKIVEGRTYD